MPKSLIRTNVIHAGKRPPCLNSRQQCRGCFGWRNMLKAAQTDNFWQSYPFRCALTGLTLKVEGKIKAESETQRVKALGLNNPYTGGLIPP